MEEESSELDKSKPDSRLLNSVQDALKQITQEDSRWPGFERGPRGENVSNRYIEREDNERSSYFILPGTQEGEYYIVLVKGEIGGSSEVQLDTLSSASSDRKSETYHLDLEQRKGLVLKRNRDPEKEEAIIKTLSQGKKVPLMDMIENVIPQIEEGQFYYEKYKPREIIEGEYSDVNRV